MTNEITKVLGAQNSTRRELEEVRARAAELQRDIDKLTTQKNYISDAFESQRKDAAKLRAQNQLQNEELVRLRKAVEELQVERAAWNIGKQVIGADLNALEIERDVMGRALGAATKQLFGRQQAAAANSETPGKKARPPATKAKPAAKALGSPHGNTPTGGLGGRRASVGRI